ncbi:MAG: DNA double-strand break repair nuclease NurA [Candidatus Bathyarchaeota archaeon]|nr:DNA double-strand break repair nuclease NurA [Candidatus Bathyarchaeota archaeon]
MKSYIDLNSVDPNEASLKISKELQNQDLLLTKIKNKIKIHNLEPKCSRRLLAADSGFNNAYESSFTVIKSAVVDDEINVDISKNIYLFHTNNYSSDRLKRLLMQVNLYQAIAKKIHNLNENSLFLVDGTITLSVFTPTLRDSKEYRSLFGNFLEGIYLPLISDCVEKDILLLGFLKRTGSSFLSRNIGIDDIYDIYIINSVLKMSGDYISPIPMSNSSSSKLLHQNYLTFFLNLNDWNYRFELLKQQQNKYAECIKNLLFWSTRTHYGMNPIFSKADEYSRVTRREAEVMFNLVLSDLSEDQKAKLRKSAKKKTHFGFDQLVQ